MSAAVYCPTSDLPTVACAHCRGLAPDAPESSRPFKARFPSVCAGCGFDIALHAQVRFVDDRLMHRGCADAA